MRAIMSRLAIVAVVALLCGTMSVWATPISGQGDPSDVIPAGSVVNFNAGPTGTYNSPLTIDGVTFSGNGTFYIYGSYSGSYNTRGVSLFTQGLEEDASRFTIEFPEPVPGFAFLWGAADVNWLLTAYDSNDSIIETFSIPPTGSSNAGDYFGIQANGIAWITINCQSESGDFVFLDNLTYGEVEERTVRGIKGSAATVLRENWPSGDRKIDTQVANAIRCIERSLRTGLWEDENHLTSSGGKWVFNQERLACGFLEHVLGDPDADEGVWIAAERAINLLIDADDLLASIAIEEAEGVAGGNRDEKELNRAAEEYERAMIDLEEDNVREAIRHFEAAWSSADKVLNRYPE